MKKTICLFELLTISLTLSGCSSPESIPEELSFKIGAIISLTGIESRQGELIKNALNLATEELKSQKIPVKIIIEDDKSLQSEA
ncbi:MAG: hypothetical protein Q7K43_00225, partial [Candidatus Woesearchaeota archaeon]|nr:hypothetical protein [Candidatus Woesearchaeota archaeon]